MKSTNKHLVNMILSAMFLSVGLFLPFLTSVIKFTFWNLEQADVLL